MKVDIYPKLQVMSGTAIATDDGIKQINFFESQHLAFPNFDEIYLELQAYKRERGWHNFSLSKNEIKDLLYSRRDWYQLLIPGSELNSRQALIIHADGRKPRFHYSRNTVRLFIS